MVHGKACMEGCMFPYQECPNGLLYQEPPKCKCNGMDMEQFQPAFGCCPLHTLVEIVIFSICAAKTLKKQEICSKFLH